MAKRKAASQSSFKTLRLVDNDKPQQQPKWLKNNPHPFYLDLWDKNPSLFWQQYTKDKAAGTLRYLKKKSNKPPQREWIDFSEIKFKKKSELKEEREKKKIEKKRKKKLNPERSDDDDEDDNPYEEGYSPKGSKESKLKARAKVD